MSSERSLWNLTREKLSPFGKLVRIESTTDKGIPDVLYNLGIRSEPPVTGLLELKHEHEWPKKTSTPVHVKSLTLEQVRWTQEWRRNRGRCWFLLRIESAFMIVQPDVMEHVYRREVLPPDLLRYSALAWSGKWPLANIVDALSQ